MEKSLKINLFIYMAISAVSFAYLVLPENAGISVPIWAVIQLICLYRIVPKKKPLLLFIPIMILAFNSFISANSMWRISNFLIIMVLYSVMCLMMVDRFSVKEVSLRFIYHTLENIVNPLRYFSLPFKWCADTDKAYIKIIKRVLIGIAITAPCLLFVSIMLASADSVFFYDMNHFVSRKLFYLINFNAVSKILYGILVGIYLFGLGYIMHIPPKEETVERKTKNGDLIILNILLVSILVIYTIFVVIQFRYLFAGAALPYGLSFTEYARQGFFELLFLSGLNILLILITVYLTKEKQGLWHKITKGLCSYLCLVTMILLLSSFYRMWLYNADDGLTRLRFLVFGFLIFESIGLIITFFYIIKPVFNIIAVYLLIGLFYYTILNMIPIDRIVAKNQIDLYLNHKNVGIEYVLTLSPDAAEEILRIKDDAVFGSKAACYLENLNKYYTGIPNRWQRFNLSLNKALEISRQQ